MGASRLYGTALEAIRMIGASNFRTLITVYERENSNTKATGSQPVFKRVGELRGQVLEISVRARMAYGALSGKVTHEIKTRGKPNFDLGKTEFRSGTLRLKPLAPPRTPGANVRAITLIPCEEVKQRES